MAGRKPKARQLASHKNADTKVREKPFPLRRKLCRIGLCTLDAEQHLEVMNRLVEACPSLASVWNSERKRHKPTGTARKKTTPKPRKVKRPDLVNTLKAEQSRILFGLLFGRDLEKFVEDMLRTRKWARKRKDNEVMAEVLTIYWQREKNPVTAADVTKYFERVGNQSIQPTAEFLAMVDPLYPFPPEIPGRKYQSVDCGKAPKNACGFARKRLADFEPDDFEDDDIEDPCDMELEHLTQEEIVSQPDTKLLQLKGHLELKPVFHLDPSLALVKDDAEAKPAPPSNDIIMRLKMEAYDQPDMGPWDRVKKCDPDAMCDEDHGSWALKNEDYPGGSPIWHCPGSPKMEFLGSQDSLICSQPEVYSPAKLEHSVKHDRDATVAKCAAPPLETSAGACDDSTSPQLVPLPEGRATTIDFVDDVILSPLDLQSA